MGRQTAEDRRLTTDDRRQVKEFCGLPTAALDIGNSRTKIALSTQDAVRHFRTISSAMRACETENAVRWGIGSVCPAKTEKIVGQIRQRRPGDIIMVLKVKDVPLKAEVNHPEKVGIDRLLAAYAAVCWKRKRSGNAPMLLCDLGTAITVDLISPDDVFLGGAILPGMKLAAKSLRRGTAQLPRMDSFEASTFPGRNTADAIRTGIFNETVGAIQRFYDLAASKFSNVKPLLLLTGGDAEVVFPEIEREFPAFFLPHLVLDGIYTVVSASNR
ncbi:MAG: type III pantothenate kinase [Planctomycetaceae bacterium]|nr:type III pantothenate kinase [Planctomycetaceae bacterium]